MQLNLFELDSMAVGQGYQSLAQFDFAEARSHFSQALALCPGHAEGERGLEETEFWQAKFQEAAGLSPEAALILLWEHVAAFPFVNSGNHHDLHHSLLHSLLSLLMQMKDGERWYQAPNLCRGYLHLQLGENRAAARSLRVLLEDHPGNGLLHRYLGDALWRQGREDVARVEYAAALLLAPHEIAAGTIPLPQLEGVIMEYGPTLAPIYGFFAGIFPLVELPCPPAGTEARACEWLRQAELARSLGDHPSMVAARRALKDVAPEILADYLAWLAGL